MALVGAILLAGSAACASLRVPPRVPVFPDSELRRAAAGPVELEARPVEGRALNWDLFDDDLPELGLAPVWVRVRNRGEEPLDLRRAAWQLELRGRSFRALDRDGVLERFYKRKKIRMYTLQADGAARKGLERLLFQARRVEPGATASGFVFVAIDPVDARTWTQGVLALRRLRLGSKWPSTLRLELDHVQP